MLLFQIISKPSCRFGDCIAIHAVRARAHDTAQPGCTKFQILIKTVFDLFFIRQTQELFLRLFIRPRQPVFICFLIAHSYPPS